MVLYHDFTNYYTKDQTYSVSQINTAIQTAINTSIGDVLGGVVNE